MELAEFVKARLDDWETYTDDDPMKDDLGTCEYLLGWHFGPGEMRLMVDSLRAILNEHRSLGGVYPICNVCARWEPGSYQGTEEEWEEPEDDMSRVASPCRTLRLLAVIWSGHADYDPAWRTKL